MNIAEQYLGHDRSAWDLISNNASPQAFIDQIIEPARNKPMMVEDRRTHVIRDQLS